MVAACLTPTTLYGGSTGWSMTGEPKPFTTALSLMRRFVCRPNSWPLQPPFVGMICTLAPILVQPALAGPDTDKQTWLRLWCHALQSVPEAQYPIVASSQCVATTQATLNDARAAHIAYTAEIEKLSKAIQDLMGKYTLSGKRVEPAPGTGEPHQVP